MKNISILFLTVVFTACISSQKDEIELPYSDKDFESEIDGKETKLFTVENNNGMLATFTNYGAKIVSIYIPDKNGEFEDVVLGFRSIGEYRKYGATHGAIVGPFANRIANARFELDGVVYELPRNNGNASFSSGPDSWYRKVWNYKKDGNKVIFSIESPDMEYGLPGNKKATVIYTLTDDNELKIDYEITTDKPTHINVTNHSYFNLKGEGNGDILDHILMINAKKATLADKEMIPTGEIADITGTAFDFTIPHPIGERIDANDSMLIYGSGYDINYVIDKEPGELSFAASVYEPRSSRFMEVFTTEPGVQLYTGNFLNGAETGKSGVPYTKQAGFCLETQHFPDTPNQPGFPSTLLEPGKAYNSTTIYRFSVK